MTSDTRGLAIACLLVAASCTNTGAAPAAPSSPASRADARSADAERCASAEQVEQILRGFTTAFNSGNSDSIERTLSSALGAVSLNVGGKAEAAYGRVDAVRYLVGRYTAGDRLRFVRVKVNELAGWDGAAQLGPIDLTLERAGSAIDVSGKGALYCGGAASGITVLGLGDGKVSTTH